MKGSSLWFTGATVAIAGALTFAQTPAKPVGDQTHAATAHGGQAHAMLKGEGITGTADFVEKTQGTGTMVEITLTVSGVKPGLHGVHLHAVGKCEPDFTAAGGHFDPGPAVHKLTSIGTTNAFVAKYAPDNSLIWVQRMGSNYISSTGTLHFATQGNGIALDGSGNVFVTGGFRETADFDTTTDEVEALLRRRGIKEPVIVTPDINLSGFDDDD